MGISTFNQAEEGFFIVWCPQSPLPPKFKHSDYEAAEREANRLAEKNPGKDFIVLRACKAVAINIKLDTSYTYIEDEIPF